MADPTADLRQQLADHEADKDKRDTKCFSNLGDCRGLSKEARRGSSQLTVWQWLTRAHRGKLTSRPRIQKQTKQEDTKILAAIQNFRRRQERYRPKQTQPTLPVVRPASHFNYVHPGGSYKIARVCICSVVCINGRSCS